MGQHLIGARTLDGKDELRGALLEIHDSAQHVVPIGLAEIRNKRLAEEKAEAAAAQARGYWVDKSTGLMWTAKDNGADITQTAAAAYCSGLSTGGFRNWRLPSIDELAGIYDESVTNGNVRGSSVHVKGGIQLSDLWVWSGTSAGLVRTWP